MKHLLAVLFIFAIFFACNQQTSIPPTTHPDSSGWDDLFAEDLSNAVYADSVWSVENGVLTAAYDIAIWTKKDYDNFILDLEFKTADSTNSGVFVYSSNEEDWIPNTVEIQILDDYSPKWSDAPATWKCGAIFGHLAASESAVKKPGQWNRYTITCQNEKIWVLLNNKLVNEMDLSLWTSATKNPDGSEIPEWFPKPFADLPTHGRIGFQGKHADAPVWFRNLKIKSIN